MKLQGGGSSFFFGWKTSQPRIFQPQIFQLWTFQTRTFLNSMTFGTMELKSPDQSIKSLKINIENWRFWKSQFFWVGHFELFKKKKTYIFSVIPMKTSQSLLVSKRPNTLKGSVCTAKETVYKVQKDVPAISKPDSINWKYFHGKGYYLEMA